MDGHCLDGAFFIWEFVPCCFGPWEVTSAVRFEPEPDDEDTEGTVLSCSSSSSM